MSPSFQLSVMLYRLIDEGMFTYTELKHVTLADIVEPLYYVKMKDDIQRYEMQKIKEKGGKK